MKTNPPFALSVLLSLFAAVGWQKWGRVFLVLLLVVAIIQIVPPYYFSWVLFAYYRMNTVNVHVNAVQ